MLAIRLQRVGRKGYPAYRVIVQEAERSPKSGRIVAFAGSYNPHTKEVNLNKEIIEKYLANGAQPSPRVTSLCKNAKIKLPKWVEAPTKGAKKAIKNIEKLRKNRPAEPVAEEVPTETAAPETTVAPETPATETKETVKESTETTPASTEEGKEA